ncbi:MAG: type II toxin-antitoxin system ParD family antitoxin [Nanoarchaeota archaeon]|nr:type II toxin-antitoxin system ParD family antitoxin [Nanoarchaeota archaeon]
MTTLSVPVSGDLEKFIERMVRDGKGANKADVVRRALREYEENEALESILKAEQEFKQGKALRGDLRELMQKF